MLPLRRRGVALALLGAAALVGCPNDAPDPGRDGGVCALVDVGPSFEPDVAVDAADAADAPDALDAREGDAGGSADAGPPVTFADVQAILTVSCTFSTCHGQTGNAAGGLYMPRDAPSTWRTQLVGVHSKENPDMFRVKPYDPSQSWMAHKVLGDNCMFTSVCTNHDCGDRMPQANDQLPSEELDVILRWIRQGAPE